MPKETSWINAGGGVSTFFPKPSFQTNAKVHPNTTFRCVPDIALNADPNTGILYIVQGQVQQFGGTSIVAPMMAGYLGLIGVNFFVNSKLYTIGSQVGAFHDITSGNNGAYRAVAGFDECTGWGSINGKVLGSALMNLPKVVAKTMTLPIGYSYQLPVSEIAWKSNNGNVNISGSGMVTGAVVGITILTSGANVITVNVVAVPNGW